MFSHHRSTSVIQYSQRTKTRILSCREKKINTDMATNTKYLQELGVGENSVDKDILSIMAVIKPLWPQEKIIIKPISGGNSGMLFRCSCDQDPENSLTVRANAKTAKFFPALVDPKFEIKALLAASKLGLFPKIPAIFQGGYCYEYVTGNSLATPSTIEVDIPDEVYRLIADCMAKIHTMKVENEHYSRSPIFENLRETLKDYPLESDEIPSREQMLKEINLVEEHLASFGYPLVLCHGDSHPGNMVYNKENGLVTFVDWELSHIGYQPEDIAYFLNALDKLIPNIMNIKIEYHPEIQGRNFIKYYLESWFEVTGRKRTDVTQKDLDMFSMQVRKCTMITQLFLGIAGICYSSNFDISSLPSFARDLLKDYMITRTEVMSMKLP